MTRSPLPTPAGMAVRNGCRKMLIRKGLCAKTAQPLCQSDRRRSTKAQCATVAKAYALTKNGIQNLASRQAQKEKTAGRSNVRKRENLAENALVEVARELRQVAMTLVLYALIARQFARRDVAMHMHRRENQHRHVHREQQPGSDMSLLQYVHRHKIMKKI